MADDSAAKRAPDWERIELDYRAGILSLRELAAPHGITEGAIRKRAKTQGWDRDLGPKIQAKADALVRKQAVRNTVRSESAPTEKEIIEANGEEVAGVVAGHKAAGARLLRLSMSMLMELEAQTANVEDLEKLGEMMRVEDEAGRDQLNDLYRKIISTPGRIDAGKKASEMVRNAVGIQRQTYKLDDKGGGQGDVTEFHLNF